MSTKKGHGQPETAPAPDGVVRAFNRSRTFVEEVLRENERLRYRNLHLQQELAGQRERALPAAGPDLQRENERLRRQVGEIKSQFETLSRENEDFRSRFQEVERQNENLLNLYVSSYQLHSTLDEDTVLAVVKEILLNLIGAEVFALWLPGPDGRVRLADLVDEPNHFAAGAPRVPSSAWQAARGGEPWFAPTAPAPGEPLCCIPLKVDGQTAGVLAVYRLLVQKSCFSELDRELLGLLAAQAATTLIGARAFSRTGAMLSPLPEEQPAGRP
ncbi:MAG TPA: GAF domain-containing protein [Candidatus Methanoperedens sp.]|nr:GAF domain-containing protein [Candidatus Methanoperedens sp.]